MASFKPLQPKVSLTDHVHVELGNYKVEKINCAVSYKEGEWLSAKEVIKLFEQISNGRNDEYYVGITCDVERREDEHDADYLVVIDCCSLKRANELEKMADKKGFDTGDLSGNANNENSTKVYIYKTSDDTRE